MLESAIARLVARLSMVCAVAVTIAACASGPPPASVPATTAPTAGDARNWLDRPLRSWNAAMPTVPMAPEPEEPRADLLARCRLKPPESTSGERALAAAGWIPFLPNGRSQVSNGVEIVGGMASADGMCRPARYNLFAFVEGRFAGTLSPVLMTSRLDGAAGMIELTADGLSIEFARYTEADPLCCPSTRVTVRYRLNRPGPVVVATSREPAK